MIAVSGTWYDGRTSRGVPAVLHVGGDGAVWFDGGGPAGLYIEQLRVSERVGNIPRAITFPDGARFETSDNDAVDRALATFGHAKATRFLHVLESRGRYIALALVAVVVFSWALVRFGIPAAAKYAAFALPAETSAAIGAGALDFLDRAVFRPSALDQATQTRLAARFERMAREQPPGFRYQLHFRSGERIGANALALPSGAIVVTDELVRLAQHDEEIIAVLAHEFGHVTHRHGLRRVMQSSAVGLLAVLITGDVSSTSAMIAALPTLLVEAQYSQEFEREADRYAFDYLARHRIDPMRFASLMERLEREKGGARGALTYVSSHPPTEERVRLFKRAGGADPVAVQ